MDNSSLGILDCRFLALRYQSKWVVKEKGSPWGSLLSQQREKRGKSPLDSALKGGMMVVWRKGGKLIACSFELEGSSLYTKSYLVYVYLFGCFPQFI
jgi:hypothetical protein